MFDSPLEDPDTRHPSNRSRGCVDEDVVDGVQRAGVETVEITGERATAELDVPGAQVVQLAKVDGEWKIARLDFATDGAASAAPVAPTSTPTPVATSTAAPEPKPDPLAQLRENLKSAGYAPAGRRASGRGIIDALVVDDVNVVLYRTSQAAASGGGEAIRSAIAEADPNNGTVQVAARRVCWTGKERALTSRDLARFAQIVAAAEGS